MKKAIALLLIVLMLLPMIGCLDARSMESYAYVVGIGFDVGETMPYKISLMLQRAQAGQTESNDAGNITIISAECRGLIEAIETISSSLPLILDFSRTLMFVFSQELACQEGVIEELMSISFPRLRIRYNAMVSVSLCSAADVFEGLKTDIEPNMSKIHKNYLQYSKASGLVPLMNVMALEEAIRERYEDALMMLCGVTGDNPANLPPVLVPTEDYAYIGGSMLIESDMKASLTGAAVFCGSRMVGILDGQHTQLMLMARGEYDEGRIRLHDTDGQDVNVFVRSKGKPKFSLTLEPKPAATVSVPLRAYLEQPEDMSEEEINEVKARLEAQIEEGLSELFYACRAKGSDAMGFGRYAVKRFSKQEAWRNYDWKAAYAMLEATFSVEIDMDLTAAKSELE